MAIATVSEFKTYAGISGSTLDAALAVMISGVQSEMELVCRRLFDYQHDASEYYDGTDTDAIVLRNAPVITSSVTVRRVDPGSGATLYTYPAASLDIDGEAGIIRLANSADVWLAGGDAPVVAYERQAMSPRFPRGKRNIYVLYACGYSDTESAAQDVPASLKMALYDLVNARLASRLRDGTLRSEGLGNYNWTAGEVTTLVGWKKMLVERCAPWLRLGSTA